MISISLTDFRDIKEANIDLNGITVLAGRNGCGKSTISKLVYQTFFTATNYENIISKEFKNYLISTFQGIWRPTVDFVYSIKSLNSHINPRFVYPTDPTDIDQIESYLANVRNVLVLLRGLQDNSYRIRLERLVRSYLSAISPHGAMRDVIYSEDMGLNAIDEVAKHFEAVRMNCEKTQKRRPLDMFYRRVDQMLEDSVSIEGHFNLSEGDLSIFNPQSKRLGFSSLVANVFYIDTPWIVDSDMSSLKRDRRLSHRNELLKTLRRVSVDKSKENLIHGIIGGATGMVETDTANRFEFHRDNGDSFDLFHCATGVKSFSILQMLLDADLLGPKTLMILDEPEAHLHPCWTFHYAKMINKLHKDHGVKFLISTHSPDMVQSISAIAEHEGITDRVSFYCADDSESPGKYVYKPLKDDFSPIFESFNRILDMIAKMQSAPSEKAATNG